MAGTIPLMIELDEEASLKTLGLLHRIPGIAKIHFNLDVFDKPKTQRKHLLLPAPDAPKANGPKANGSRSSSHVTRDGFSPSQAILKLIGDHGGPMTRQEMRTALGANGDRAITNLTAMEKAGTLKKVGPATYDLATRSSKAPTTIEAKANKNNTEKATGQDIALATLAKGGRMSKSDFRAPFEAAGRSYASVGDVLFKLIKSKKVKSPAKGAYELA